MKSVELHDILTYRFLSNLKYAPDGKHAAFVLAQADREENCYERCLYLWDGAEVRRLTSVGKEGTFEWENGGALLFPAVRSAKEKKRAEAGEPFTAWYRLSLSGGEALPAFTFPFICTRLIPMGGTRYAALGLIDRHIPDYYLMTDAAREKVLRDRKDDRDYEVLEELPFWSNGGGFTDGQRTALFLYDSAEDSLSRVTEPTETVESAVKLGDRLYYTVTDYDRLYPLHGLRVDELDPATGVRRTVAVDHILGEGRLVTMGGGLYALASAMREHGLNENAHVWRVDTESGAVTLLRAEQYSMYGSVGTDCRLGGGAPACEKDGALLHITTREGCSHLYRLSPDGSDGPVYCPDGSIDSVAACDGDAPVLFTGMLDMRLQELYALEPSGKVKRLTHFNDAALKGRYVARPRYMEVRSRGLTIGGWVLEPKDYDPAKRYPAVLDIHGGPKTVYGPVFMHEMQLWAGMGYFVFYCNPMGSDGRDSAFMDIRGHYGDTDYANLMDFTDAVLAAYPAIDPKRLCETGGSYGGFMTNWIIGHTDRFRCCASQRSISNWFSFYGVSDIGYFFAGDQCDGDPWAAPERLWSQSPLKYADRAVTPTLFIHSDEDYRCPLPEGLQMYAALVEHGVPARLVLFHGENHELSRSGRPLHRLRRLREITDWFEKYAGASSETPE